MSASAVPRFDDFVKGNQSSIPSFEDFVKQTPLSAVKPTPPTSPLEKVRTFLGGSPEERQAFLNTGSDVTGKVADVARGFATEPAIATGLAAGAATPGPLPLKAAAGAGMAGATYFGLDKALQKIKSLSTGSKEEPSDSDSIQNLLVNLGLGKIIGRGSQFLSGVEPKVSPNLEQFKELEPTVSKVLGHPEIQETPLGRALKYLKNPAAVMEGMFAPGKSAEAAANSGQIANKLVTEAASDISGHAPSVIENPQARAGLVQANAINSMEAYNKEIGKQAKAARVYAAQTPIVPKTALELANQHIQDMDGRPNLLTEADKTLYSQSAELIRAHDAQFADDGTLIKAQPIPFGTAWDMKQNLDAYGGYGKTTPDITPNQAVVNGKFRQLTGAMNEDIGNSLVGQKNKPAYIAWKNAKSLTEERNVLFHPENFGGTPTLGDIVEKSTTLPATIKATLAEPTAVDKALQSGKIKMGGTQIYANNMRQDLAGARLMDTWENGFSLTKGDVSASAIKDNFNDLAYGDVNKKLYSQQTRSNINQLLDNAAQATQKPGSSWLPKVAIVRGGLMAAPVALGLATGSLEHFGQLAGVEIGASIVAQLMASKTAGRVIVNMAGGMPLGMSEQMAARRVAAALQGLPIALVGTNGKRTEGSLNREGEFEATSP